MDSFFFFVNFNLFAKFANMCTFFGEKRSIDIFKKRVNLSKLNYKWIEQIIPLFRFTFIHNFLIRSILSIDRDLGRPR